MNSQRTDWLKLAQTGLTVALGAQTIRLFLPLILYTYGVREGVSTIDMGLYAIATFLGGIVAAPLWQFLKPRLALLVTAGGLGLLRLVVQFTSDNDLDLTLMTAGIVLFLSYLPVALGLARRDGRQGGANLALGILLGLTLDTALHGAWRTYDLGWRVDAGSHIVAVGLVAVQQFALVRTLPASDQTPGPEAGWGTSLALLAVGPFLFLNGLVFQNVARITAFLGSGLALAFSLVVVSNALAVACVVWLKDRGRPTFLRHWWGLLLAGLGLVICVSLTPDDPLGVSSGVAIANVVGLVAGNALAAILVSLLLMRLSDGSKGTGLWRTSISGLLMGLFFAIPAFLYYVTYDIRLPFSANLIPTVAAGVLAMVALLAARKGDDTPGEITNWRPAYIALGLLVLPLLLAVLTPTPATVEGGGGPLRIVNYNLHMGFGTDGRLDVDTLARVIAAEDPDIVVLQEVSRGWYINASMDMLTWLSYKLDMPYVFVPAADPIWGNAILSRYPLTNIEVAALPRDRAAMKRSYFSASVDYGAGEDVRIIGTHLHHLEEDTDVRVVQVQALIAAWGESERTLIMGDMNARPGQADVVQFTEAGLLDVYSETGTEDSLTFISNDPYELIDWIFASADVTFEEFNIPQTTASDHLPLVITVSLPD